MVINQNVISYALLAIVIIVIVHLLFNNSKFVDTYDGKIRKRNFVPMTYNKPETKIYDFHSDEVSSDGDCPVTRNDDNHSQYLQKTLLGTREVCPNPTQSTKNFHNDFFNFRDSIYQNSSIREDSVDKIQSLYLDGNLSQARRYPNMKIKDLFDELTKGPNLYERQCVRLPQFDNINPDGYHLSYGTPGTSLTRDNWSYKNEKIMNGGRIVDDLYPNDNHANNNLVLT